jgi:hypothetical protein
MRFPRLLKLFRTENEEDIVCKYCGVHWCCQSEVAGLPDLADIWNRAFSGVCHTDHGFCTNSFGLPMPAQKGISMVQDQIMRD